MQQRPAAPPIASIATLSESDSKLWVAFIAAKWKETTIEEKVHSLPFNPPKNNLILNLCPFFPNNNAMYCWKLLTKTVSKGKRQTPAS